MERAVFVTGLERLPPPPEPCDRLYLGSESCAWRLPGEGAIRAALDVAAARGIGLSLVTPFLDEPGLARALALVRSLPADPAVEIVVNDLGLLEELRGDGRTLVAGRLLTRQRRGPGFQAFGEPTAAALEALRGSALDSPAFVALLHGTYGVARFELDDLVQGIAVPELPPGIHLSLYRPWLLVTATRNCPWVFDGRTWHPARGCAAPCRGALLRLAPEDSCASALLQPEDGGTGKEPRAGTCEGPGEAEGWREAGAPRRPDRREDGGGAARQDPEACTGTGARELFLGACAQFLEHRSVAPPPPGVDRIVWQPEVPA